MADFRDLDLKNLSLELDKFKYFIGGPGGPTITLKATTGEGLALHQHVRRQGVHQQGWRGNVGHHHFGLSP